MHDDIFLSGVSAADLGGPELATLGQAVQDLKRENSRKLGSMYGNRHRPFEPDMSMGRGSVVGASTPESQAEVESLGLVSKSSSLGSTVPLDASRVETGGIYDPMVLKSKSATSHQTALSAGGVQQQVPLRKDDSRKIIPSSSQVQSGSSPQQSRQLQNCGYTGDVLEINQHELLGSEAQRNQRFVPQPHVSKQLRCATLKAQGEGSDPLPRSQTEDARSHLSSLLRGQGNRDYLSALGDRQGLTDQDKNRLRIRGTVSVENRSHGSLNLQVRGKESYRQVFPGAHTAPGLDMKQAAKGFTADGQKDQRLSQVEHDAIDPKSLPVPGRNTQATSKSKALSFFTM